MYRYFRVGKDIFLSAVDDNVKNRKVAYANPVVGGVLGLLMIGKEQIRGAIQVVYRLLILYRQQVCEQLLDFAVYWSVSYTHLTLPTTERV